MDLPEGRRRRTIDGYVLSWDPACVVAPDLFVGLTHEQLDAIEAWL